MNNSVTSPSGEANLAETENEQEVKPFKPMIIKPSALGGNGHEYSKTTTKKSPSDIEMQKLTNAIGNVNIQAKLPVSTTNKSVQMKLHLHNSLNES